MDVRQIIDVDRIAKHFEKLGDFMDGIFDDLGGTSTFGGDPEKAGIRVTKMKTGEGLSSVVIVEIEVPGCSPTEVSVLAEPGQLTVQWTPRMTGKAQVRKFSLSKNADVDSVSAKVKDGFLTVTIPAAVATRPAARKVVVG
jgi:HSP20 family molecular chaperone IbpA